MTMLKDSKKKLTLTAGAVAGAILSTASVFAAPATVYDRDGVVLKLDHDKDGAMKLTVTNTTKDDMHDVVLTNENIKGLVVSDKQINLGTVRAGETRDVDFKYSLEKATVSVINKAVSEKKKEENKETKKEKAKDKKEAKEAKEKSEDEIEEEAARKKGAIKTGDDSFTDNKLLKIAIPVVIAGVAGTLVVFVLKKDKKKKHTNTLALLMAVGALGTAMFATAQEVHADFFNINRLTGRVMHNIPIQGTTVIDGEEYEYAGTFYYEKDDIQTKLEERAVSIGVDIEEDSTMPAGSFRIVSKDVREGQEKVEVTYLNGRVVKEKAVTDKIPARNYKVVVGTKKVTETKEIPYTTVYKADKGKKIGYKETVEKGANGEEIVTYTLAGNLDDFKKGILSGDIRENGKSSLLTNSSTDIKAGHPEVIAVGTRGSEEVKAERKTEYVANNEVLITEKEKVLEEGADGLKVIETVQDVDPKTGELLAHKEVVSETVTEASKPRRIEVGAKEVVEEEIPYTTIIEEDGTMWKGEEKVIVKGQNGLKTVTYIYEVDPEKGRTDKKTAIEEKVTKEPVAEKVKSGTKEPGYIEKKEVEKVKPGKPVVENFVSDEALDNIKSVEDYNKLLAEFNALVKGKRQLDDGSYVVTEAKEGEIGKLYKVPVDPETGNIIESLKPELISEINTPAVNQVSKNFNLSLGETRQTEASYEYVANPNLPKGEKVTKTEAKAGEEQAVRLDNGKTVWIPSGNKPAVKGIIEVGNREVVKEEIEAAGNIIKCEYMFEDESVTPDGGKGIPGEKEVTYEYVVNPQTGELGEKKVVDTKVTREPQGGEKWVGVLKRLNVRKASSTTIQSALDELNRVRTTEGLSALTLDTSQQDKVDNTTSVLLNARLQGYRVDHIPTAFNDVVNHVDAEGLSDSEVGVRVIETFMNPHTSHTDTLLRSDISSISIGAYYAPDGLLCTFAMSVR